MNTLARMVSLVALTIAPLGAAQPARPAGFEELRIKEQDMPVFPYDLIQLGVREGQACIAFSVDVAGKVDDCLAVAYTHPEFARVALLAVRRWKFEPARLGGEPIATATEIVFNFEVKGTVVVSLTAMESAAAWMNRLYVGGENFYPHPLRELDRIPTPLAAPAPAYPRAWAEHGRTGAVTVNFYIDETGAVRLPAVASGNDPDLAALAITAIQRWKFEPPTRQGRKVLTKTSQVFRFLPPEAPEAGTAAKN